MVRSYNAIQVIEDDRQRAIAAAYEAERENMNHRAQLVEALVNAGLQKLQTEPGIFFPCDTEELAEAAGDAYSWIVAIIAANPGNFTDDELSTIFAEVSDRITDQVGENNR